MSTHILSTKINLYFPQFFLYLIKKINLIKKIMGESNNIWSRAYAELALALRRAGVDISGLSHTEMLKKYIEPYLKAAGEGNEGAAMVKANMELVKGMTPQLRLGLAEDISKINYSGLNPSLEYALGNHNRYYHDRGINWMDKNYGIQHYGLKLPIHGLLKLASLIMPYRYIDLSDPEYNKRLSDNYNKLMGMDIGYSGVRGLGEVLNNSELDKYLFNEFAYDRARRGFLNSDYGKGLIKQILKDKTVVFPISKSYPNGMIWTPTVDEILSPFFNPRPFELPDIRKKEYAGLGNPVLESEVPKFGKVNSSVRVNGSGIIPPFYYTGLNNHFDIWTSTHPVYVQRYTDHPYSVWKTYHSGDNMLTAPRLPMINLGYTYKNMPLVFNKEKGALEFHPDFKLNLETLISRPSNRSGDPEPGTHIQEFTNGDPERKSKMWTWTRDDKKPEMTADDLLLISKENGFSGIIIPDFYGNQTWRVYNPDVELIKAPSWEPAWVTAYKMTKHKKGGKLIPKHQKTWNPLGYLSKIFRIGSKETKEISTLKEISALKETGNFLTGLTNKESAMMAKLSHLSASEQKKIYDFYKLCPNNYKPHLQRWILNGKVTDYESLLKAENAIKKGLLSGIDLQLVKDYTTIKGYDEGVYKSNKYIEDASNGMLKFRFQTPGWGFRIFDVLDSKKGAEAMRSILDEQYGENAVPWCLSNPGNIEEIGTGNSWWEHYNGVPKRMVFDKNGNLLYFHANASPIGLYWNMQDVASTGLGKEEKKIKSRTGGGFRTISTSINPETGEKYTDQENTYIKFPKGGGIFSYKTTIPNGNVVHMYLYDNNNRYIHADLKDYSPKHVLREYDMPGYLGKRTYDLNGKPLYLSIYRKVNVLRKSKNGEYWVPYEDTAIFPRRFKVYGLNGAYQYGLDTGRLIGSGVNETSKYLKLSFNNHPIMWGLGTGALASGIGLYGLYKFYDQ